MEPIYLVNKNSGLEYEVITIVFYLDKDCYKVKPCAYRYSAVPYIYIPITDVGADKEYYIKKYYIKETDTDKEESLCLVKGDESYKILGICKVGPDLVYKIDLPSPQISPYSPRLSPYILKSVVDAGDYQIKRIAERDKTQKDPRRERETNNIISKDTAVEYLIKTISDIVGPTASMTNAFITAKQLERQQHGRTWDAAIEAYEQRGNVFIRSICDFDDYKIS